MSQLAIIRASPLSVYWFLTYDLHLLVNNGVSYVVSCCSILEFSTTAMSDLIRIRVCCVCLTGTLPRAEYTGYVALSADGKC